ncbi:nuclear transport factor 2 family protein [Trichocoleus sp. DQ-A3]|uniref:nuclear transport factor 2 family protein n=1 Tax=Cyanophyceae TaxID=3028117 RepID=UPI0016895990|nr:MULTISPECIES: nuclear transport factor 2 family protein [unclassified Coleofasciculus]MBD1898434.1 nuclear transport factor 2 family protein [Coleofasciculus sp. FACHB-125]MBD2541551.1 nuclear transport factor 2 family protein [Coleofasciculus sp. FACHB-SPT36]
MNPEDIRIAIAQARDAWIARDGEALAALFTPNGEIIVPGQRWQGQERIRQEVAHFAQQYSDVRIEIQQVIVDGDRAVVEWYYEDTENSTGRRNKADDVIVISFKEGWITRWREYFDTETPKLRT